MNTDEYYHLQYQILASQLGGERLWRIVILKVQPYKGCTFRILLEDVLYFFTIHIEEPKMCNDISGHPFSQALISSLSSVTTCLVGFYICPILTSLPLFCISLLWLALHVSRNFLGHSMPVQTFTNLATAIRTSWYNVLTKYCDNRSTI
jgi:hypothetical protein